MKRWGTVLGLGLAVSVLAAAQPSFVPTDPPVALVQADPGRTTFTLSLVASGWTATLARSVSDACDVVAVLSSVSTFDVRVRALLLPSLFPLRMAFEVGRDRVGLFGALHLGPVRLVGERCWGNNSDVRVALHAFSPSLAAAAGAELGGKLGPFIALTWFPYPIPLWSITVTAALSEWRLSIGGTW